jgi:hypothetical protein
MMQRQHHLLKSLLIQSAVFFCLCSSWSLRAQDLVLPDQSKHVNQLFNTLPQKNSLRCRIQVWQPTLGFDLAYSTGFTIVPGAAQLSPGETLVAFFRVTPAGHSPVLLSTSFKLPVTLPHLSPGQRFDLAFSGDFVVGEGAYSVELLFIDQHDRKYFRRWNLKTHGHAIGSPLAPSMVAATPPIHWNGETDLNGFRLTVLLNATESSPIASRLSPRTSAYLFSVLDSILRQVPCRSAKVIAFNLDEQSEIFHSDRFNRADFASLAKSLKDFSSAAIPVTTLRPSAWGDFLLGLVHDDDAADGPSDAVIFVGVPSHFVESPTLPKLDHPEARFFDFEYFSVAPIFAGDPGTNWGNYRNTPDDNGATSAPGAAKAFPDSIDRLTRDLHGTVFQITSPGDLGPAIQKMLTGIRLHR